MKKQQIAAGLNGLLKPAENNAPATEADGIQAATETRPVCYNLNPATIRKIRYISLLENRRNNSVVNEALDRFISDWEQSNGKIPAAL